MPPKSRHVDASTALPTTHTSGERDTHERQDLPTRQVAEGTHANPHTPHTTVVSTGRPELEPAGAVQVTSATQAVAGPGPSGHGAPQAPLPTSTQELEAVAPSVLPIGTSRALLLTPGLAEWSFFVQVSHKLVAPYHPMPSLR